MAARIESLGQDLKAWAADLLGVEPGSAPEQIRAAYLRQAQQEPGVGNLAAREALLILTGRNAGRPTLALDAVEAKLQSEVDAFASQFFALAVMERKAEWQRLSERGKGFLRVAVRLEALRAGLSLVVPHLGRGSPQQDLVTAMCELFVLRPAQRAARRRAFLKDAKRLRSGADWAEAAQSLWRNHVALAVLEPELLAKLADTQGRAHETRQLNRKMSKVGVSTANGAKSGNSYWWIAIVVAVLSGICRMAVSTPSSRFNSPPPAEFKPAAPNLDPNSGVLKNNNFRLKKNGDQWEVEAIPKNEKAEPDKQGRLIVDPKDKQDLP